MDPGSREAGISITARGRNSVDAAVTEQMGDKAIAGKDLCERGIADAETTGIGAEGRHHSAHSVTGEAAALHRAAARGDAGLGMQMAGDLAMRAGRLMSEGDGPIATSSATVPPRSRGSMGS